MLAQTFPGNNHLAFTISSWDFGEVPRQTEDIPEYSDVSFGIRCLNVGLTFGRQFTDRIAAGATMRLVTESIDDVRGRAVAFDPGMTYVVGESGLRMGVSLKNVGSDMSYSGDGLVRVLKFLSIRINTPVVSSSGFAIFCISGEAIKHRAIWTSAFTRA